MSIRRYLVLTLVALITLITFAAALKGYRSSMQQATSVFDVELKALAYTLVTLEPQNQLSLSAPEAALAFQIWQQNQLVLRSDNSPLTPISEFEDGFAEHNFAGQRWQTYSLWFPAMQKWVMVAQPLSRRFELAEQVILAAVTPLIISIPFLALIIFLVVSRGLSPLRYLSNALSDKKVDDLVAIRMPAVPKELTSVISTLNLLLLRLESAFVREKRFASDAAHELRTPLSVLKINAHNLALELSAKQQASINMLNLTQGVERMSHVVDQILLLNRTEPQQYSASFTSLDLAQLCRDGITSLYPQIDDKHQEIEFIGQSHAIIGDQFALEILIQNLISNACKYSPQKGRIRVSLTKRSDNISLLVEDSGPGIAEEEYNKVFERFYRVGGDRHNSNVIGCGLGLAIVKHIADLHLANIELSKSASLGGLTVKVVFKSGGGADV
jgi:two-component system, OmpR family, sensor histidine kinase QseC